MVEKPLHVNLLSPNYVRKIGLRNNGLGCNNLNIKGGLSSVVRVWYTNWVFLCLSFNNLGYGMQSHMSTVTTSFKDIKIRFGYKTVDPETRASENLTNVLYIMTLFHNERLYDKR
jgi:hypothetical protein